MLFFFSRDITVPRPQMGEYYFMLVAYKDFHELLGMVSYQMSTITFLTIIILSKNFIKKLIFFMKKLQWHSILVHIWDQIANF